MLANHTMYVHREPTYTVYFICKSRINKNKIELTSKYEMKSTQYYDDVHFIQTDQGEHILKVK